MSYYNTLVLSGGSVKNIATLGALQFCYDQNYIQSARTYIGTSAGGIICYLLAIGYTPIEILIYICVNNIFDKMKEINLFSLMNGEGAIDFTHLQEHLERMTINKIGRLVSLQEVRDLYGKTLIFATYNMSKNRVEYLTPDTTPTTPCIFALKQSSALPFVFPHVKYMGDLYIDGGIYENFPILYDIENEEFHRLGVYVDFYSDNKPIEKCNMLEYIYNILIVPSKMHNESVIQTARENQKADILKVSSDISMFSFDLKSRDILDIFSSGYTDAKNHFNTAVQNTCDESKLNESNLN